MDILFLKNIIELITSMIFLIGVTIGFVAFRYKYDANVRDLYVENSKKINEILSYIIYNGKTNSEIENLAKTAYREARLYLHPEIISYTEKILYLTIHLGIYEKQLETIPKGGKRIEICDKARDLKIKAGELIKQYTTIYRKHIIQSPIEQFKLWLKNEINNSYILSFIKNKTTKTSS